MTLSSTLTLAIAMVILAATPGPGILVVTSQTVAYNLRAGFLTTLGIICADMFFILLVTYGLATLAKNIQSIMIYINLFGGLYLIFLGVFSLKNNPSEATEIRPNSKHTPKKNIQFLLSGFLITLSNPKAILFYLSFLPAFVDLASLKHLDVIIIMLTAIITIIPTMMAYAWISHKASSISHSSTSTQTASAISTVAAILIIVVGCYMLYRSMF